VYKASKEYKTPYNTRKEMLLISRPAYDVEILTSEDEHEFVSYMTEMGHAVA
jgi:hypothetical protein